MQLVIDTNILVSFFRENPVRFIITNSDFLGIRLFIPEYAIEELEKNEDEILKYSKLNLLEFKEALEDLKNRVELITKELFKQFELQAKQFSPHDKDLPYFALALYLNCRIWSNEPAFKKQAGIKIFNTKDLREILNI